MYGFHLRGEGPNVALPSDVSRESRLHHAPVGAACRLGRVEPSAGLAGRPCRFRGPARRSVMCDLRQATAALVQGPGAERAESSAAGDQLGGRDAILRTSGRELVGARLRTSARVSPRQPRQPRQPRRLPSGRRTSVASKGMPVSRGRGQGRESGEPPARRAERMGAIHRGHTTSPRGPRCPTARYTPHRLRRPPHVGRPSQNAEMPHEPPTRWPRVILDLCGGHPVMARCGRGSDP